MSNILVIGLDERSCSLIKFLKNGNLSNKIYGYDLDFDTFKNAVTKGLIENKESDNFERVIIKSDFIILNIPVDKYDTIFFKISAFVQKECIITDINTAKKYVFKNKKKNLNIREPNFIQSNCLFDINQISQVKNGRVLINSAIDSRLEIINKLSLFWKERGFDTENLNVVENDIIMSRVLHLPFILKLLTKHIAGSNREKSFLQFNKSQFFWYEDIFYNKNNIIATINEFADLMASLDFKKEASEVFFSKALIAREKQKKIFNIYDLKAKKTTEQNSLFDVVEFLLQILFVGEFLSVKDYFYLNNDAIKLSLFTGQEFECAKIVNQDKEKFVETWEGCVKKLDNFRRKIEREKNDVKEIKDFLNK